VTPWRLPKMIESGSWINNEILAICLLDELTRKGSCDTHLLIKVVGSLKEGNPFRIALEDLVRQKGFSQGISGLKGEQTGNPI